MQKKKLNIVLFNPQIPPNTGNIIRLCSNTNSRLFLIKPLGFEINDKYLKRACLDYHKDVEIRVFDNLSDCIDDIGKSTFFFISKFGKKNYFEQSFNSNDTLIFGSEIDGIPDRIFRKFGFPKLFIPIKDFKRSLNLSNAVSICLYEVMRQNNFSQLSK